MIKLIEATEEDFPIIQDIARRTWPETFGNILSKDQIDYMLEMMYSTTSLAKQVKEKQHKFLLAKEGADFLGYASYQLNYDSLSKTKIHKIYILPAAQGKSVGSLLMNKITEIAKNAGDKILSLNVNRDNAAIKFYEKRGFIKVRQENIEIGNGFVMEDFVMEDFVMEKNL